MATPTRSTVKSGSERTEARPRATTRRRPPLLAEQLAAGIAAAVIVACVDGAHAALGERATDLGTHALATLHTVAFYVPAGIALGALVALVVALLRATPSASPLLRVLGAPHLWFAPAPRVVAPVAGWLAAVALVALVAREAYAHLATVAHRIDLAAWTMAGIVAAATAIAALASTAVRSVVTLLARWTGRLGSPGALVIALAFVAARITWSWLASQEEVLEAYGALLALVPTALAAYIVAALALRLALSRTSPVVSIVLSAVLVAGGLAAWTTSALTYGRVNAVRTLVEEETMAGRWMLRRYTQLTDLDGDRHSWGFGGRDCDDFDARVHPGTLDEAGDGVDLDCFAGDGAPLVVVNGDGALGRRPPGLPPRPNVVLVTIDALRPDHLGVEGYPRDTSPNIDAFARGAVRFREVLAPSSRSIRSIPAMFTGLYPSQIGYGDEYLYPAILAENTTLAEVLQEHGWKTGVTMGTEYFHRVRGFYQGFEEVDEILQYKPPREQTVDRALAQLERLAGSGQPFFQWIHLFHVHRPYLDPAYPSRYGRESVDAYDTEVHLADEQFQRVLAALAQHGIDDDTIVILASDHGEAFWEHGRYGHASTLYEEELDAVMMMRVPGVEARRVDATVSLIDLTPTVLNLAGLDLPHPMPAQSLVPLMTGEREPDPHRWFFGELLPDGLFPFDIKMIRRGAAKLHWWVRDGTIQLFDLDADPAERRDRSDADPEQANELLGTLQAWVARSSRAQHQNASYVHQHTLAEAPSRMTHPLGLHYPGMFTVLGCDVPDTTIVPGGTLGVICYYRVEGEMDANLVFRLMLEGPRGYPVPRDMHAMHVPLNGRYPTNQWRAGEILRDPTPIPIPRTASAPVDLWLTLAVEDRAGHQLLSYEQHGRSGSRARITLVQLVRSESERTDAGAAHDAGTSERDAGVPRDAGSTAE